MEEEESVLIEKTFYLRWCLSNFREEMPCDGMIAVIAMPIAMECVKSKEFSANFFYLVVNAICGCRREFLILSKNVCLFLSELSRFNVRFECENRLTKKSDEEKRNSLTRVGPTPY